MSNRSIKETLKGKYGQAALRVQSDNGETSCCAPSACGTSGAENYLDPITSNLYDESQRAALPAEAVQASLGCGNPTALADLREGETVLDLGSGGGIDVLLSARRVGPSGKAYGLDMTDEMLELARANAAKARVQNVEFLKGEIENVPLPASSVDVIISNCVINLSADKDRVFAEAFRVLKPGGRLAVSDVVVRGEVPAEIRRSVELWAGCVAGALDESDYASKLARAGFREIGLEPTRVYHVDDARAFLTSSGVDVDAIAPLVDGQFMSAFIRARKPTSNVLSEITAVIRERTLTRAGKARRIAKLIRAAGGYRWVGVYDVSACEIAAVAWTGSDAPAFPRFPVTQGLCGAAVSSRAPVIVGDVSQDPRYLTTFGSTRSEMVVPVVGAAGPVVGLIDAESERLHAFTATDRALLETCASALLPIFSLSALS